MTSNRISSKSRRRFIKAAGVTGTASLAGCIGGSSSGYTISFWELFSGGEGPVMEDIVQKFNEEQPLDVDEEVTIDRQRTPWDQYYNNLYTTLAGGSGPDLAVMHAAYLRAWDETIVPLDNHIDTGEIEGDYLDNHWDLVSVEGETRALPMDLHPVGMYYNKAIFEEAGLDPESPPTNWEEFEAAGNAIAEETDKWAFSQTPYNDGFGTWRTWSTFVKQQGGELLDSDWNPAFDGQAGQDTSELFWDMTGDMEWSPQTTEADWGANAFENGNLGMTMNGTWYVATLEESDIDWGFFKPTIAPNRSQDQVWADGHTIVLPRSQDRSDDKSEIAAEVAHWLTTKNPEWGARAGHLPAAADIRESDVFQDASFYDKTLSKYLEMAEDDMYFYHPKVPNGDPNSESWYQWLLDMWGHNYGSPQEALDDGVSMISNGLEE
ncbi:substrate-binding domain-containing protein [Natrinema soli]|uniref:Substrate-binding domain-containing protein n=1 Tax=Natrinema soli TaxID=1930624 RepID=A0ABD5SFX6_9EURY|nr:substrate-binding domain-containing protein [Natrinema soli]